MDRQQAIHADFLLKELDKLRHERRHLDYAVVCGSVRVECHKLVMAIFSDLVLNDSTHCSDVGVLTTEDDPTLLVDSLYNWTDVNYLDYLNNLALRSHDLMIRFMHNGKRDTKTKFSGDDHIAKLGELRLQTFYNSLNKFKKMELLTDVVLETEEEIFKCHKVILSAVSDYFDTMFLSGMQEETHDKVTLHGVDPSIMRVILDFIYTGRIHINVTNADVLYSTSVYLQIPLLQKKCAVFLVEHLDFENAVDVLRLADTCSDNTLKQGAMKFILTHFCEISNKVNRKFCSLSVQELCSLLKHDDLVAPSENDILNIVLVWFDKQTTKDETTLLSLLQCIRLYLIRTELLQTYLSENKHIKTFPECKKIILQHTIKTNDKYIGAVRKRHAEVMVVLVGSGYQKGMRLACYSFITHQWYQLSSITSYTPGCSFSACIDDRNIFVSGGTNNPRGFHKFSLDKNSWIQLENMKNGRSEHSMAFCKNKVYCIGGTMQPKPSFSRVDMFCEESNTWSKVGDLSTPTANAACCVIDNKILVFGGTKSVGVFNHDIQSFNTSTDQCTVVSSFPKKIMCGLLGLVSSKEIIYLTTTDGKIVEYRPGYGNPDIVGIIHNQYLIGFASVFYKGSIYIIGGSTVKSDDECIRQYNLTTRKSSIDKGLRLPFECASNQYFSAMMMISKSFLDEMSSTA